MEKSSDGTSCLRTGSRIILYLVLLLFPVFEKVKSDALLSSWLVNCTRHQHEKVEKEIDCIKKMLLHFSIDNGKRKYQTFAFFSRSTQPIFMLILHPSDVSGESDTIETFVTQVREYNGGSRDLEEPYRITMYKSDIYVQYPLQFLQSFNGNPHEVESFAHNCKDDSKDKTPNCGWLYNKAGEKVKDSQDSVEVTSHLRVDINSRRTMKGKLQAFSIMNTEPPDLADQYLSIPYEEDESERLANGETPLYAVSRHGKVFASHQTHNSTLNLLTNQTVTSLLTLEVKADDLKYFVHRSPGKIMEASFESTQTHLSGGLLKVEVRSLKPRNTLSSFTFNVSETDDSSYFSTCKVFLQDNMGDKTDTFEVKLDYPSRDELAFLLRAEATGTNSKNSSSLFNWIYSLFNYTKWFGVFNTTFNFCWFSCPKNTLESESSTGGQSTFRCEYSSQTIPDLDENGFTAKCPDAPGTPTGSGNFSLYNIFTWTPCGECSNIVLDFKCYVTTLCWKEILSFVMYVIAAIILIYFAWLLHQAGILGPIISTVLSFIAMICKLLCGCLTILFGGRRSGGGEGSSSDGDNDGGGSRGRRKKRKRKRKKKWKRKRHKKRKWW
ncbi:hypothetical protein AXG93_948s1360 [Marchantia polymorpha subsp. ruderalis]|uniref:Generative cell specific-1/HAP2 domain-containing protein n=1 Tax=Marchantia polymorpha subsp. ruderalis TaxID=1480154 RepID=A0A176VHT9_MARPO|nr:hypothetical protein AXG93_948s1360 [Marchantia polymorpha subsp. ruderalis]